MLDPLIGEEKYQKEKYYSKWGSPKNVDVRLNKNTKSSCKSKSFMGRCCFTKSILLPSCLSPLIGSSPIPSFHHSRFYLSVLEILNIFVPPFTSVSDLIWSTNLLKVLKIIQLLLILKQHILKYQSSFDKILVVLVIYWFIDHE